MDSQCSDTDDIPLVDNIQAYIFEPDAVPNLRQIPFSNINITATLTDSDRDPGPLKGETC